METKKDKPQETLGWIKNLPNAGGAWGFSVESKIEVISEEVATLNAEKAALMAKVAKLDDDLKKRKKILRGTVRSAHQEAVTLFGEDAVKDAIEGFPAAAE